MLFVDCVICNKRMLYTDDRKGIHMMANCTLQEADRLHRESSVSHEEGMCTSCYDVAYDYNKHQRRKFYSKFSEESIELIPKHLHLLESENRGKLKTFYSECKLTIPESTFYRYVEDGKFEQFFEGQNHAEVEKEAMNKKLEKENLKEIFGEEKKELGQDEKSIPPSQDNKVNSGLQPQVDNKVNSGLQPQVPDSKPEIKQKYSLDADFPDLGDSEKIIYDDDGTPIYL